MQVRTLTWGAAALLLTACVSSPIQKMSAKDAVAFGYDQYFDTPNYRFTSQMHLNNFDLGMLGVGGFPSTLNRVVKRMTVNMDGVIDRPNQQYEVIGSLSYKAKNLQANIAFPFVYDGRQKAIFADVSALDDLLANGENENKYSRFDVSHLDVDKKAGGLIDILRKTYKGIYQDLPTASFVELPLSREDRRMDVVRKIQVTSNIKDASTHSYTMFKDLMQWAKPEDASIVGLDEPELEKAFDETNDLIDPNSTQVEVLGFDKAGRIVQGEATANLSMAIPNGSTDAAKGQKFNISSTAHIQMSEIGSAKLSNPPTASNTVDGVENFRGGFAGRFLADVLRPQAADAAASDAEPAVEVVNEPEPRKRKKKHP